MKSSDRITIVTDDRLLDHHTGGGDHPEVPERLVAALQRLRGGPLGPRLDEVAPREADRRWLATAHDPAYIARFEEMALSEKSHLDHPDNQICFDSYEVAPLSAGCGLTGVDRIEQGASRSVFCCMRPPGHHAERALAMGFCFFNNAVIAARYWQQSYGRKRIAICDWDAHHGNGIQAILANDPTILYVSIHEHPTFSFPGTGRAEDKGTGEGKGANLNIPLPPGAEDKTILTALLETVEPVIADFQPDALIVAAGFDGHHLDDMSRLAFSTELYHRLGGIMSAWANRYCDGRLLSILEGGYHLEALAASLESYLMGLADGMAGEDTL